MGLATGKKSDSGSVMVEFALVSMILILLLVGIIEFGLIFNTQLTLQNAARDGARFTAIPSTISESVIKAYIINSASTLHLNASQITLNPAVTGMRRGQPFTVTINYPYQVPVTFGVLPASLNLTAATVMMKE